MNYLVDSHAHIDDKRFDEDREELLEQIRLEMDFIVNIGSDMPSSRRSVDLSDENGFIYATVGIHPHGANEYTQDDIEELRALAKCHKVRAIGEIGLDYHYDNTVKENQQRLFKEQLHLANELNLPVVIHSRDSNADTMEIIRAHESTLAEKGVLHCFSGNLQMAREAIAMGYLISFAGPLTYKKARVAIEVAEHIPLEKILIETDCPYLPPEGHRGQRNMSPYVRIVAEKLAAIRNLPTEEILRITNENTRRLFKI